MNGPEHNIPTQGRLIGDLRLVIENAEELLKNTDRCTSDLYRSARAKLVLALQAASDELAQFEEAQLNRMMAKTRAENATRSDLDGEAKLFRAFE